MRKKNSFIATIIAVFGIAFIIGCSESYPGITYDQPNDVEDNGESSDRIPIMVTVNTPQVHFTTRGSGPLDNMDNGWKWKIQNTTLYVYAFLAKNKYYNGPVNYKASATDNDEEVQFCLIDGSLDGDAFHGKKAEITGESGSSENNTIAEALTWANTDNIPYYSNMHQDYKYNFFIYHLDDAYVTNPVRADSAVYFDIEINGTQDIMSGIAYPSQNSSVIESIMNNSSSNEDYTEIINDLLGERNYVYSTKLGHRGVHPNFNIKHELVNFKFNIVKGDDSNNTLRVTDIIIKNCKTQARFTVAANDTSLVGLNFSGNKKNLHLPEKLKDNSYSSTDEKTLKEYSVDGLMKGDKIPIGAGLLLAPDSVYSLVINCKETLEEKNENGENQIKEYNPCYNLSLKDKSFFSPGNIYEINISVYGTQKIELQSNLMKWELGGSINIGDENDQFNN